MRISLFVSSAVLLAAVAGCGSLPSAPMQPARYDLGSGTAISAPTAPASAVPVLAMADIQERTQNENSTAVLYRLGYADGQVLHAYGQARWSQPPAMLVQQRVREILGQGRTVLSAEGGNLPPLVQGQLVPVLQLSLEEFVHHFIDSQRSEAVVRLRATLIQPSRRGDTLLGQQVFSVRTPAAQPNAQAGTQALAKSLETIGAQMQQWLQQLPAPNPTPVAQPAVGLR